MNRRPVAGAVSAVFLSLGLGLIVSTPAAAEGPSFTDGVLHCPDGKTMLWRADRAPPSESEQRIDCALNPRPAGSPTPPPETSAPALSGLVGTDIDRILEQSHREEIERKKTAELVEHQHLLAGKFGDWAAFNAALKDGRGDIWARILGKWAGILLVALGALWLLFGRKR